MEQFKMAKLDQLQQYLETGAEITPAQIMSRFKLMNPSAAVHALRQRGLCIYANPRTLANGNVTTNYRVGTPSRTLVAYAAAAGFFSS